MQELDSIFAACLFRAKLQRANVCFLSQPVANGTTGTVIVLTSPDAQRTMLSYQVQKLQPFSLRALVVEYNLLS